MSDADVMGIAPDKGFVLRIVKDPGILFLKLSSFAFSTATRLTILYSESKSSVISHTPKWQSGNISVFKNTPMISL